MPQGTVDYYNQMAETSGSSIEDVQSFARLFMAPGIAHCGMDTDPFFHAVQQWVETGEAPETLPATLQLTGGRTRTRPLCPHPKVAVYKGSGSTDDASNFACGANVVQGRRVNDTENADWRANERVFGLPYVPSGF
jgi:feruloyl esterase